MANGFSLENCFSLSQKALSVTLHNIPPPKRKNSSVSLDESSLQTVSPSGSETSVEAVEKHFPSPGMCLRAGLDGEKHEKISDTGGEEKEKLFTAEGKFSDIPCHCQTYDSSFLF